MIRWMERKGGGGGCFFFNDTATTEIYTLSLHDALSDLSIPIKVFPTGFRMAVQEPAEKEKLLLYIGAFEERKGIDNILNLAQRLDKSYTFVLVGSRKETEINALNAEVQRRGIDDRVQVREWLSKKELNEMLLRAKIGLLPLKAGYFNEFLTVPLKYFDYAAFGLPVIASDFP